MTTYIQGNGPDVLALLERLPEKCAAILPGSNRVILLRRGVTGYYPMHASNLKPGLSPAENVQRYNDSRGVTPAQHMAMLYGSCFGWDTPSADPATWESENAG